MIPPRPLPLAPRPFSDESVRSWIGRVAARYDLEPMELIARLRGGAGVEASRISSLDWSVDAELEILLAHAARLDRSQISALRILARGIPFPATWHRRLVAWCSACVGEDVGRYGETYERAAWRLGCCVACSTHRLLLEEACLCVYGGCRYRGRSRGVCGWFAGSAGDLPMDCKRACRAQMLWRFGDVSCLLGSRLIFKRICLAR
jgi:hypothetical protein